VITAELAKRKIKAKQFPFALQNKKDEKAYLQDNQLVFNTPPNTFTMPHEEIALQGIHNLYNSMAAGLAASSINVKKETIRDSFRNFQGVAHRLEYVATVRGIRFINDSKATNVNSCWYALQSMKTPVTLILGGTDKGNDYNEIEPLVQEKVHTLIFLGTDNRKLHGFFDKMGKKIIDVLSMEDAVKTAYDNTNKGETVLLSPCCASFDLFKNYEDRGDQFKQCVRNL
jgi:UDP-N-acetylmuramoylalanine--D-glutamate ligase